ncbi:MAG: hypothetical protein R6U98_09680 [Pirellulaceae bacterium]
MSFPDVTFETEAAGSRTTARKVSELGRGADLVMSADYTVIDNLNGPTDEERRREYKLGRLRFMR